MEGLALLLAATTQDQADWILPLRGSGGLAGGDVEDEGEGEVAYGREGAAGGSDDEEDGGGWCRVPQQRQQQDRERAWPASTAAAEDGAGGDCWGGVEPPHPLLCAAVCVLWSQRRRSAVAQAQLANDSTHNALRPVSCCSLVYVRVAFCIRL